MVALNLQDQPELLFLLESAKESMTLHRCAQVAQVTKVAQVAEIPEVPEVRLVRVVPDLV